MGDAGSSLLRVGNAAPQQMPDVRGEGVDFVVLPVDGERERLAVR